MGFKFKRFDLTVGSEDFPAGTTDANILTKCQTIVKNFAQKLISMGIGWTLDSSRNASVTDYAEVPDNSTGKWPGLFLVNTTSGCKLFVCNIGKSGRSIKNFSGSDIILSQNNVQTVSGLCMSMIPGGSSNTFGLDFDASFLPSDATRIYGTAKSGEFGISNIAEGGDICSCGIYATEYVISVVFAISSNGNPPPLKTPNYAVGRILSTLSHEEDDEIHSKYGVCCMRFPSTTSGVPYSDQGSQIYDVISAFGTGISFIGNNGSSFSACGSICQANGTWLLGYGSSPNRCVKVYPASVLDLSNKIFNSNGTGKSRWIPLEIVSYSDDLSTYGIVPGDGVKGYLDTDLFRCAISTYGQQFDNGNFIAVTDSYNLLMGWDSTNTDSIA